MRRLLLALLLLAACRQPSEPPPQPSYAGPVPIQAPARAPVAQPLVVTVGPLPGAADGLPVTLIQAGSYGARPHQAPVQAGVATFLLTPEDTQRSGLVTLIAQAGAAQGEAELLLEPGPPVEPLTPLVGARSIVADGEHWAMAVAVPFDAWGNPMADGTPVEIQALHPGDRLEALTVPVQHLLAWTRIWSGTQAGRTAITVRAGQAFGPEKDLLEIPGWPVPFAIAAEPQSLPADGRQLLILRSDVIVDRFGNVMPDGTQVTFLAESAGGEIRAIPGYTVDGRVEVPLQAAPQPGTWQVQASVYGVASDQVTVTFSAGPAVNRFPMAASLDNSTGSLWLTAGPLLGPLEQHVPDGSVVVFQVIGPDGQAQRVEGLAEEGYARVALRLAELPAGNYLVEARAGTGSGSLHFHLEIGEAGVILSAQDPQSAPR